mgnify:CR=1 FL=1
MELIELKRKYNEKLSRNRNAENYFRTHKVEECLKYLDLFNEVTKELSELIKQIEQITKKKMTKYEILNGFKL